MKKLCLIVVGVLVLGALFGGVMAGCGGGKTDASDGPTTTLVPDKYPVPSESYKIGIVIFSNTDLEVQATIKYLKGYLGPKFNVSFLTSEDIDDADAELTFLENCAASGCKGILAFQSLAGPKAAYAKCQELGMYYVKSAKPVTEQEFSIAKGNPFFVGGVCPMGDRQLGYDCVSAFLEGGARKIGMSTGGRQVGNYQHTERTLGAEAAIADFEKANPGVKVELTEFAGYPGDAFNAAQAKMIAANPDAVFATFAGEDLWVQPLSDAGKAGVIKLGTVSSVNEVSVRAFKDGTLSWFGGKYGAMSGLPFALLYNWMTGYRADYSDNGEAIFIPQEWIEIVSAEDMEKWLAVIEAPVPPFSADDLKAVCKAFNPSATLDDFKALATATHYEDIVARRAAGN